LLRSSTIFGGFLVRMLSGLGFVCGGIDLTDAPLLLRSGTVADPRSAGFLCVICDWSTFLSPDVMASPWLSWSKTAPMSPLAGCAFPGSGGGGGPPEESRCVGSGGGGGGPPLEGAAWPLAVDSTCRIASETETPSGFHVMPPL
jgi:hypothetical protein